MRQPRAARRDSPRPCSPTSRSTAREIEEIDGGERRERRGRRATPTAETAPSRRRRAARRDGDAAGSSRAEPSSVRRLRARRRRASRRRRAAALRRRLGSHLDCRADVRGGRPHRRRGRGPRRGDRALLASGFGMPLQHRETVAEQGVEAALLGVGDSHVELLRAARRRHAGRQVPRQARPGPAPRRLPLRRRRRARSSSAARAGCG